MVHKINGKHVTPTHHLTIWKRIAIGVIADGTVMGIGSVIGGAILVVGSLVLSTRVRKPVLVIVAERRATPLPWVIPVVWPRALYWEADTNRSGSEAGVTAALWVDNVN
jgi:hypothetical protein